MALLGYARVPTATSTRHALTAAGRDKVFTDHASGTLAKRPGLE